MESYSMRHLLIKYKADSAELALRRAVFAARTLEDIVYIRKLTYAVIDIDAAGKDSGKTALNLALEGFCNAVVNPGKIALPDKEITVKLAVLELLLAKGANPAAIRKCQATLSALNNFIEQFKAFFYTLIGKTLDIQQFTPYEQQLTFSYCLYGRVFAMAKNVAQTKQKLQELIVTNGRDKALALRNKPILIFENHADAGTNVLLNGILSTVLQTHGYKNFSLERPSDSMDIESSAAYYENRGNDNIKLTGKAERQAVYDWNAQLYRFILQHEFHHTCIDPLVNYNTIDVDGIIQMFLQHADDKYYTEDSELRDVGMAYNAVIDALENDGATVIVAGMYHGKYMCDMMAEYGIDYIGVIPFVDPMNVGVHPNIILLDTDGKEISVGKELLQSTNTKAYDLSVANRDKSLAEFSQLQFVNQRAGSASKFRAV